jgi:hypothetical protein
MHINAFLAYLSNMSKGENFVNKSVKLLHDLICKMLISPLLEVGVDRII